MERKNDNQIVNVENAKIIFKNFRGEERQFNAEGNRNFTLVLTEEMAKEFRLMGFNVRERPPRDEDGDIQYLLPVAVGYKYRQPKIMLINNKCRTMLTEETVEELDYADIEHIDLTIRPYHWSMANGQSGVKAYLNSMYVTLVPDEFAAKYDVSEDDYLPFGL